MTEPRVVLTEIAMGESPRWHGDRLWFADWIAGQIVSVGLDGSSLVEIDEIPSLPICFDFLPDGTLVVMSSSEGLLLRCEPDGSLVTHADVSGLADTPWNEVLVDPAGRIYLNNIGFEYGVGEPGPGFVAVVRQDGSVARVADGLMFPNGMAVSPDGGTLIVAESFSGTLTAFDIAADGSLPNRRTWAAVADSAPDGICIDAEGAVWYADVPNQHCVRVAEGGQILQTVPLDRAGFACELGGPDGRTLYAVTAKWPDAMDAAGPRTGQLVAVEVAVAGVR